MFGISGHLPYLSCLTYLWIRLYFSIHGDLFLSFLYENVCCWYAIETLRHCNPNEYPQYTFQRNTIFDLITAHTPISAQSSDYSQCTFCLLLYKGICCGYSFELHCFNAIQMSTHNVRLYKENKKKITYHHQISLSDLFYSVSLVGRYIFYHKWLLPVILKNLSAQCRN